MLERLKKEVLAANLELHIQKLVVYTWGNVSGIDRKQEMIVIKPSGVPYEEMTTDQMVVVDFNGRVVEGTLRPSSDTPTHLFLYQQFPGIGGVVHTHSPWATVWAQARLGIPCYGTTHADYFYGEIPCTRLLTDSEINDNYELNTGKLIAECFRKLDFRECPGVLAAGHGPFTWGASPAEAVHNSVVLEQIAQIAYAAQQLTPGLKPLPACLQDKHYLRKHGINAYYGQGKNVGV